MNSPWEVPEYGKKFYLDIKETQREIERLYKSLPPAITRELNGGISILPQVKINPVKRGKQCYILGEYCSGGTLGRYINIYFGSFEAVLQGAGEEAWKDKIREVLFHEFTHHLEDLAGENDLEKEDERLLASLR